MPTLSLTVSDEVATRLRTAYGVANNADLKTAVIQQIKDKVKEVEATAILQAEDTKIHNAVLAKQTATDTLASEVETNVAIS